MFGGVLTAMGLFGPGGGGELVLMANVLCGTEFLCVVRCEEVGAITSGT